MSNDNSIRNNILAAIAAFAVSTACIIGTVGPVAASQGDEYVQLAQIEAAPDTVRLG